jgi:hypothetical protein
VRKGRSTCFFLRRCTHLAFPDLLPLTPALSPSFPSHPNISATTVVSTLGAAAEKKTNSSNEFRRVYKAPSFYFNVEALYYFCDQ